VFFCDDKLSNCPLLLSDASHEFQIHMSVRILTIKYEYGLPSRVRSDKGGEHVESSWYMLTHPQRGLGRGSMITGNKENSQIDNKRLHTFSVHYE